MDKRVKLGIPFNFKPTWIAGPYYVANLIEALNSLSDEKKPHIIIYYDAAKAIGLLKNIGYPYISFRKQNFEFLRFLNKVSRAVLKKKLFNRRLSRKGVDLLFPAADNDFFSRIPQQNKIYWIPDFQEHFYPDFFTKEVVADRKKLQQGLVNKDAKIVFSSNSSRQDFFMIYPEAKNETFVLPFAVSHSEEYKKIDVPGLLQKFNLPASYFFCANQFWKHKNHITILKALAHLKKNGKETVVAFSGNQTDYRNPQFFESLMQYVAAHQLESNTRFLGFIDRNDQLALMKNSLAVIQPSLFEGWSTTVEDSKSLNVPVILSDIPIHREQLQSNVTFFAPLNEQALAEVLEHFEPGVESSDYSKNRIDFANAFYAIVNRNVSGPAS